MKYRVSARGLAIVAMVLFIYLLLILLAVNYVIRNDPIIPWGSLGLTILFMTMFMWSFTEIEIDNEGIRLYRWNVMKWNEVVSAKRMNAFGLKYLQVTRRKGMKWSIPLYLRGHPPIEVALKEKCPAGNPIHQLLLPNSHL